MEVFEEFVLTEAFGSGAVTDFPVYVDLLIANRFHHRPALEIAAFRSDFLQTRRLAEPVALLSAIEQANDFRL